MEKYSLLVLRKVLIDFIILALVGGVMYGLKETTPFQRGFFCGDESIMYPYRNNTVTSDMLHYVGIFLPGVFIIICELATLYQRKEESRRCFGVPLPCWLRGCYSVLVSFAVGLLCTELATNLSKVTIGRLRPCFIDVCKPNVTCSLAQYQGRYILPEEFVCTNTEYAEHTMRDIRLSFMSGHSSWAAFCMIFLALYLQKRLTWRGMQLTRHIIQFTVVMLSFFAALSRVSDNKHHWSDVLFGYSTGALFAIIMVRWGVHWVERHEHSLLPQNEITLSPGNATQNTNNSRL